MVPRVEDYLQKMFLVITLHLNSKLGWLSNQCFNIFVCYKWHTIQLMHSTSVYQLNKHHFDHLSVHLTKPFSITDVTWKLWMCMNFLYSLLLGLKFVCLLLLEITLSACYFYYSSIHHINNEKNFKLLWQKNISPIYNFWC